MALELLRAVRCLDYLATETRAPALEVTVTEAVYARTKRYAAPIDTGFSGYMLLPSEDYIQLATMELPREEFGTYITMAGPIVLRRAQVKITIADRVVETIIETPLHGGGRVLLGRNIINQLDIALLGSTNRCCLLRRE